MSKNKKVVHYFYSGGYRSCACGISGYYVCKVARTKDKSQVTCKSCMNTKAFKNSDSPNTPTLYSVVYKNKVLFTGNIKEVESWLQTEAMYDSNTYTIIKLSDNQYKGEFITEFKLTKIKN